jgi:hypothetical protein
MHFIKSTTWKSQNITNKLSLLNQPKHSDCCLRQLSNFSGISRQEQVHFQSNDQVYFVLDQHAKLDLYSASSLKHTDGHVAPLGHIILIPS